jgi:hypothetical protein
MSDFRSIREIKAEIEAGINAQSRELATKLRNSCEYGEALDKAGIILQRRVYERIIDDPLARRYIDDLISSFVQSADFPYIYVTIIAFSAVPDKYPYPVILFQKTLTSEDLSISVGRKDICNLHISEFRGGVSRYHLTLTPFINKNGELFLSLIDIGSLAGIFYFDKSFSPIPIKKQICGKPELIPIGQDIYVRLAGLNLVIRTSLSGLFDMNSIKECIICVERSRSIMFNCEHFICCSECALKCTSCPICRSPITSAIPFVPVNSEENVSRPPHPPATIVVPIVDAIIDIETLPLDDLAIEIGDNAVTIPPPGDED